MVMCRLLCPAAQSANSPTPRGTVHIDCDMKATLWSLQSNTQRKWAAYSYKVIRDGPTIMEDPFVKDMKVRMNQAT
jgi:hypothetical protein